MAFTKNRAIKLKLFVFLLTLIFCIVISEIGMRVFLKNRLRYQDDINLACRHDVKLGWFPIENSKLSYTSSRSISIEHNSRGFRDAEHLVEAKRRIVFLGDSFVWGYDVEKPERFTEKLSKKLPDWLVYNLGVCGYGTDQEYLLLEQHYDFYRPNIVFLVFCINDNADNSCNKRYHGYYKPYIIVNEGNLEIRGTPVPKQENYYFQNHNTLAQFHWFRIFAKVYFKFTSPPLLKLKDPTYEILSHMQEFVHSRGGLFLVGLHKQHSELEKYLKGKKIPYVDLSEAGSYTYPDHGKHWTPEGHTLVSEKIYEFLTKGNYLEMDTMPD